ncbi:hypothetical protein [Paraburkholderia sp. RL17-337-BIB-A]|uniref:hypothetical protein n=1 Tax=Paraburkholderia sp. RL17-337-BIB-A TaxID=3031636 RepID=UPI0038BB8C2B
MNTQQKKSGTFVEVRAASSSDAHYLGGLVGTKWIRAARIWVRTYDDSGVKTAERFFGFVDTRCTGPRSHAGRVLATGDEVRTTNFRKGRQTAR